LVRAALGHGHHVVVSIFVNPTQFGPAEDLDAYPRQDEEDIERCRRLGVDTVFLPSAEAMYAADAGVYVGEDDVSRRLCGRFRPGHFRGVLTVVAKLFNTVQPDVAVFGRKDAQQAWLISRMVRDLDVPVRIQVEPIVREPDGLAMSSRNRYLGPAERKRALCLHAALQLAERLYAEGNHDAGDIITRMEQICVRGEPPVEVDYIEAVDYETFQPVRTVSPGTLFALAVRVGGARLIDNHLIEGS